MKFSKLSQLTLVSSVGLLVASCFTACSITTIDYVYVADSAGSGSSSAGQIQSYAVDSETGAIRGAGTYTIGDTTPVAMALSPDYANLYVATQGSNKVTHFAVNSNGSLSQKESVTLSTAPVALAVSGSTGYLFVASGTTSATLTEYSLSSGTITTTPVSTTKLSLSGTSYSTYAADTLVPTSIALIPDGSAVYVGVYDISAYNPAGTATSSNSQPGLIYGYQIGTSGALTATTSSPYAAGVKPSALVVDPTDRFLYATDYASNQLIGYTLMSVSSGRQAQVLTNGPFKTGNEPSAIAIDPRGKFIYVTNMLDNSVAAYTITQATGTPSGAVATSGVSNNTTGTYPVSIAVDPALGRYVFTADNLANDVTGFKLDATAGTLAANQASPYPTGYKPTAIVIVPHGNHAIQVTNSY